MILHIRIDSIFFFFVTSNMLTLVDNKTKFNSLPNDKILDCSKLKAFGVDKINAIQKLMFQVRRVQNIVGKGENVGYHHFFLFLQAFHRLLSQSHKNLVLFGKGLIDFCKI